MLPSPVSSRTSAISSRFSDAWLCTRSACCRDKCATASSSSREHDTANRGAKAARSRPLARPFQRAASARLSSTDACVRSSSRAGTARSASIMHLPTTARSPVGSRASNTASVSCTVSIVRTAVVPPSSNSDAASEAAAASDRGVCAASMGQMRVRSQSRSTRSSA